MLLLIYIYRERDSEAFLSVRLKYSVWIILPAEHCILWYTFILQHHHNFFVKVYSSTSLVFLERNKIKSVALGFVCVK